MKGKRLFLTGLLCGVLIGGALAFLSMPFIMQDTSFLIGLVASLLCASCLLLLMLGRKKNGPGGMAGNQPDVRNTMRSSAFVWILLGILIVLISFVSSWLIVRQNEMMTEQLRYQKMHSAQLVELQAAVGKSSMVVLMGNLFDKIDDELKEDPKRMLSEETIARIAALSYSFQPYKYLEGDSVSAKAFSPERGQLLLALSKMQIDTSSLYRIMLRTSFAGADLKGAHLPGAYLRGIDLSGANLQNANLNGANLRAANLYKANLWGVDLGDADLLEVDLRRADLRWADLHETQMYGADLSSALLSSAQLRKADLRKAILQWADFSGAFFNEANLAGADLLVTNLAKTHFKGANLCETNFTRTNLTEAELTGAHVLDEKWLTKLQEISVIGATALQARYRIVHDTSDVACPFRIEEVLK